VVELIDIEGVVKRKFPKQYKKVPKFVFTFAKWLVCQDILNQIIINNHDKEGADFAEGAIKFLNVKYTVYGEENIPENGRFIFTSNHPLGGFDGVSYIKVLGERYPGKIKLIVNDILMSIVPLRSVFLPVNTLGKQKPEDMKAIEAVYKDSDIQLMTFPAGFCSRYIDGKIQDIAWKKSVISQAVDNQRDVIPMYFDGRNSVFFYSLERFRRLIGMKFNIGLILLPWQTVRTSRNKSYRIYIGKPIPWQTFDKSKTNYEWAQWLREQSYKLKPKK